MNRQVAGRIKHGERAEVELTGYGLGLPHETELVEKLELDEWLLGMEQDELKQLIGKAGAIWILRDAIARAG